LRKAQEEGHQSESEDDNSSTENDNQPGFSADSPNQALSDTEMGMDGPSVSGEQEVTTFT